jgi:hypothetical protein
VSGWTAKLITGTADRSNGELLGSCPHLIDSI